MLFNAAIVSSDISCTNIANDLIFPSNYTIVICTPPLVSNSTVSLLIRLLLFLGYSIVLHDAAALIMCRPALNKILNQDVTCIKTAFEATLSHSSIIKYCISFYLYFFFWIHILESEQFLFFYV